LTIDPLHEKGIKAEYKGGLIRESVEAPQLEYMAFWISTTIGITSGAITIGDFIYKQLKKLKNTKAEIGGNKVDSSVPQEEIQKIIEDELKRLKEEIENLKKEFEKEE